MEWKEYWGFLDLACDLSTRKGLEALENYLDSEGDSVQDIEEGMAKLSLFVTPTKSQRRFLTGYSPLVQYVT